MTIEKKHTDRDVALLAIDATQSEKKTECIPDEILAGFIDQRLEPDLRLQVIEHLNQCRECMARCTGTFISQADTPVRTFRKRLTAAGIGFAAAAMLILGIYLPSLLSDSPESLLKASFNDAVASYTAEGTESLPIVALPWESKEHRYAFAGTGRMSPVEKAFSSGLVSGKYHRKRLTDDHLPDFLHDDHKVILSEWKGSPEAVFFTIGKWCYLISVLSDNPTGLPENFYPDQSLFLEKTASDIRKLSEYSKDNRIRLVLIRLKGLSGVFSGLTDTRSGSGKWPRIKAETDIIIQLMTEG